MIQPGHAANTALPFETSRHAPGAAIPGRFGWLVVTGPRPADAPERDEIHRASERRPYGQFRRPLCACAATRSPWAELGRGAARVVPQQEVHRGARGHGRLGGHSEARPRRSAPMSRKPCASPERAKEQPPRRSHTGQPICPAAGSRLADCLGPAGTGDRYAQPGAGLQAARGMPPRGTPPAWARRGTCRRTSQRLPQRAPCHVPARHNSCPHTTEECLRTAQRPPPRATRQVSASSGKRQRAGPDRLPRHQPCGARCNRILCLANGVAAARLAAGTRPSQ